MRYGSIIFDFDSTVVDCETLDLVSEVVLAERSDKDEVLAEVKRITALGMEGAIPFGESLARRMALIAPTRAAVADVASRMLEHITPSFLAHKDFLAQRRDSIYIVSGGFDEIIAPVADALGREKLTSSSPPRKNERISFLRDCGIMRNSSLSIF
jgi:D-3-phosphoglycerate dehydrogenase